MHYLWNDCETSGTDPSIHELWEYYGAVYDENLEFIDDIHLFLKPDDWATRKLTCDVEAEKITGINPQEHLNNPRTILYSEGREQLIDFLSKHKIPKKRKHFRMSGHNVGFDKDFIEAKLFPDDYADELEKLVHHRVLDTLGITTFLQDIKMLPSDLGSLTSLVEFYDIKLGNAHEAKDDVKMNVAVYRAMQKSLIDRKGNLNNVSENNLMSIIEMI